MARLRPTFFVNWIHGINAAAWLLTISLAASCSGENRKAAQGRQGVEKIKSQASLADAPGPHARVMIVSFDGLRPDAISEAHTPTLISLMRSGSSQLTALAEVPSTTLPNHSSMVTGLTIPHHGVFFNSDRSGRIGSTTIFDVAREAGVAGGFFATKSKLKYLCNEDDVQIREIESNVEALTDKVVEAIQQRDLRLIFVHFGEPDGAGHAEGWMTEPYFKAAGRSDAALARILMTLEEKGIREETVIIVSADHGGHGKIHGFDIPEDRLIPFIIAGPEIAAGRTLCGQVRTMDTAATALHLLGLSTDSARDGHAVVEALAESETAPCDGPAPVFSMPCGPLPFLLFVPMMLGMWAMRIVLHHRVRS